MQKHFEEQFASHNASLATHEPWECDDPVLVTVAEVQWHLDKLPARKAGAPSTSPGAVWRLCSDLVSPFIAQQLSDRWGQGSKCVPHLWTTATLALLLKAGKNGSEPKHFRPILASSMPLVNPASLWFFTKLSRILKPSSVLRPSSHTLRAALYRGCPASCVLPLRGGSPTARGTRA